MLNSRPMEITINGESRRLSGECSLADLLSELGHGGKRVAVEHNGEVVPRARHAETRLGDGDRLEIIVAVGGG